jgi:hypothetical protein
MIKQTRPKYPTELYGNIYIDNIQKAVVICLIIPTKFIFFIENIILADIFRPSDKIRLFFILFYQRTCMIKARPKYPTDLYGNIYINAVVDKGNGTNVTNSTLLKVHLQGGQRTSYIRVFFYRKLYNGENCSTI